MNKERHGIEQILNYKIIDFGNYYLTTEKLIVIILIILFTKIILVAIKKSLFKSKKIKSIEEGKLASIAQISSYIGWTIAIILILNVL